MEMAVTVAAMVPFAIWKSRHRKHEDEKTVNRGPFAQRAIIKFEFDKYRLHF